MGRWELYQKLPDKEKQELEVAIETLISCGAQEIYLFGSMTTGQIDQNSDWDFAVRGIGSAAGLHAHGILLTTLQRSVDLIDLDFDCDFASHLESTMELVRVA